jgi:hypothetical protein
VEKQELNLPDKLITKLQNFITILFTSASVIKCNIKYAYTYTNASKIHLTHNFAIPSILHMLHQSA